MRVLPYLIGASAGILGCGATAQSLPPELAAEMARDLAAIYANGAEIGLERMAADGAASLVVTADGATIHAGASEAAREVAEVAAGTELAIVTQAGDWFAVRGPAGETGWVSAADVAPGPEPDRLVREPAVLDALRRGTIDASEFARLQRDAGFFERRLQELMVSAGNFRDRYRDNPYVAVDGFSLSVGLPPSLNVSFRFKE